LEKISCGFMKKILIEPYAKQGFATIKKKWANFDLHLVPYH
jgi:hypothetical protein